MKTNQSKLKRKWLSLSIGGLILNGAGLSIMGEGLILKYEQAPFIDWFIMGTLGLILINAGISLIGGAVITRVKMKS